MADPITLTRNQIARFVGNDPEAIKALERLFQVAGTLTPSEIATLTQLILDNSYATGAADNKAEVALASATSAESLADLMAKGPLSDAHNSLRTDYLDLNLAAPHVNRIGRLSWNDANQTADLGMEYGVIQQIGLEYYARVENMTGVMIPNGTVVGFAGVGANNVLSVTPYLADGTLSSLYILGVLTHDLPDSGEVGYCTTWGHVRGIDTSAFSVGDILYASPTVAGALTATKPTAPDNVIPVAAVLAADAVNGEIFVRPTIEQQQYYGEFSKTGTVSPAAINTSYAVTWDNVEIANGISIVSGTQLTVVDSGLYQFDLTLQLSSGSSSAKTVRFWYKKNGTNVPNSTRIITLDINNGYSPLSMADFFSLAAGEYIELWWQADDTNVSLATVAAGGTAPNDYPAAPAALIAVTQVQQ
jgi:hypothetical protein